MSGISPYPIVDGQKRCPKCTRWQALSHYAPRRKGYLVYYRGACRDCERLQHDIYRNKHRQVYRQANRDYQRRCYANDPNYYRKQYRQKLLRRVL